MTNKELKESIEKAKLTCLKIDEALKEFDRLILKLKTLV